MISKWIPEGIATGLWMGKSPVAPGTVGTVGAVLFWFVLSQTYDSFQLRMVTLIVVTTVGWIATHRYLLDRDLGAEADPSEVVIDEWAGMLIVLLVVPSDSLWQILAAFCLFRIYDIMKIWPVSQLEKLPGAHGIMLDDLCAGLLALGSLLFIRTLLVVVGL